MLFIRYLAQGLRQMFQLIYPLIAAGPKAVVSSASFFLYCFIQKCFFYRYSTLLEKFNKKDSYIIYTIQVNFKTMLLLMETRSNTVARLKWMGRCDEARISTVFVTGMRFLTLGVNKQSIKILSFFFFF